MGSLPLHPLLVHVPLGVAVIMPLVAAGLTWAWLTGRLGRTAWLAVVGLQLVLVVGAIVALKTGQAEEERVERVVAESAIQAHEEAAELFLWAGAAVLLVAVGAGLVKQDRARRALAWATTAGTVLVLALAIRAGHAGGSLVYEQGAASAYVTAAPGGHAGTAGEGTQEQDDDDD